jgi:hypothetical protein
MAALKFSSFLLKALVRRVRRRGCILMVRFCFSTWDVQIRHWIRAIDAGEKFSKGDILVVQLRTRQIGVGDKIRNEHSVLKVTEHIPAERQAELPFSTEDSKRNEGLPPEPG